MNLILSIKKSCLNFAADEKWMSWNRVIFYAQLFAHTQKVIAQRMFMNLEVELLTDFITALTDEFSKD